MGTLLLLVAVLGMGQAVQPAAQPAASRGEVAQLHEQVRQLQEEVRVLTNRVKSIDKRFSEYANRADGSRTAEPGPSEPASSYRSDYWRTWHFADGSSLEAELVDFASGEAVLRDATDEEVRAKTSELSAGDRKFVQDAVRARTELEKAKRAGAVVDCPNKNCKRGTLYGPVSSTVGMAGASGAAWSHQGRIGPVGKCPTCNGRGVVPNPARGGR